MNVVKKNLQNFRKIAIFSMAGLTFLAISSVSNPAAAFAEATANCADGNTVTCSGGQSCTAKDATGNRDGRCYCYDEDYNRVVEAKCGGGIE